MASSVCCGLGSLFSFGAFTDLLIECEDMTYWTPLAFFANLAFLRVFLSNRLSTLFVGGCSGLSGFIGSNRFCDTKWSVGNVGNRLWLTDAFYMKDFGLPLELSVSISGVSFGGADANGFGSDFSFGGGYDLSCGKRFFAQWAFYSFCHWALEASSSRCLSCRAMAFFRSASSAAFKLVESAWLSASGNRPAVFLADDRAGFGNF